MFGSRNGLKTQYFFKKHKRYFSCFLTQLEKVIYNIPMNIEQYRTYCLAKKGVTESIPFPKLQNVLVFKVLTKMFTVTDINTFDSFSIKCNPDTIDELRAKYMAVQEPAYFSKKHWSNVIMDGTIKDELLYKWIDLSYDLVVSNMTKKLQSTLKENF